MEKEKEEKKKIKRRGADFISRLIWAILAIMMLAGVAFTLIYAMMR